MKAGRWLAVLGLWCCASVNAGDLEAAVRELMVKSGIDKQSDSFSELVRAGMQQARQQHGGAADADHDALEAAAAKAFSPTIIKTAVARAFTAGMTATDINAALAWLNSPVGTRITKMEEAASTAEAYAAMQAWAQGLKEGDLAPARVELVRRLDRAVKATEFSVSMMMNSQLAIVAALTATQPAAEQARTFEAARARIEQHRPQLLTNVQRTTLLSMLYAYRELPDADLERYIEFARSPGGSKYMEVAMKGLDEALLEASRNAGRVIADHLRQKKQKAANESAWRERAAA